MGKPLQVPTLTAGGFNSRGTHVYTSIDGNTRIWRINNEIKKKSYLEPRPILVHGKGATILAPKGASNFIAFCKLPELNSLQEGNTSFNLNSSRIPDSFSSLYSDGQNSEIDFKYQTSSQESWTTSSHSRQFSYNRGGSSNNLFEQKVQEANNDVIVYGIALKTTVFQPCKTICSTNDSPILNVVLHTHFILVVHLNQIVLYDNEGDAIFTYDTCNNPLGLVAVAKNTIAFPGTKYGNVAIVNDFKTYKSFPIQPHQNPLTHLSLNQDGTLLATASESGTMIQIYYINKGEKYKTPIKTFRRGTTTSTIYSIAFSPKTLTRFKRNQNTNKGSNALKHVDQCYSQFEVIHEPCQYYPGTGPKNSSKNQDYRDQYVAVLSGNGTIHLFSLSEEGNDSRLVSQMFQWFQNGESTTRKIHEATEFPGVITFDQKYINMVHLFDAGGQFRTFVYDLSTPQNAVRELTRNVNLVQIHKTLLDKDTDKRSKSIIESR